ncbi:MAG: GNAT family N-acetyltransferase [Gemmataceae bacterium]|nr:GNAT family N-acetyltransferase [Gemmataceae bacterium]
MKVVPYAAVTSAAWDEVADRSGTAWLFHRAAWIDIESRFFANANRSFAVADDAGRLVGIQPLYRRSVDRGWRERVIDCGVHRHTGLAVRDDVSPETLQAARKIAMRQVLEEAELYLAERVLLNEQDLAPALIDRRTGSKSCPTMPFWVQDYGFELGMHVTPVGDLAVPGMSTVFADQVVFLDKDEDELFRGLDSACQRAIRKAQKSGLSFDPLTPNPSPQGRGETLALTPNPPLGRGETLGLLTPGEGRRLDRIAEYYELARVSAERTGEPLPPIDYYQAIGDNLGPSRAHVLFARKDGQTAAALLLVVDKQAASYLAGVSHHEFLALRVNDYVHWQVMLWLKNQGVRYYRLGPIFPQLPDDWPVSRVSRFKGKFGGQSIPVIQGNYFRNPERYRDDAVREAARVCDLRIEQETARRKAESQRHADPARDLVVLLRRYGFLGFDPRAKEKDLVEGHGCWWPGCATPLAEALPSCALVLAECSPHAPRGEPSHADLAKLGIHCRLESGRAHLYEFAKRSWWKKKTPVFHALLQHCSFHGPNLEPIWHNAEGRAVLALWHHDGRRILLVGLNLVEEILRHTQGDPKQARKGQGAACHGYAHERAEYLFEPQLLPEFRSTPWADRLGFAIVRALARATGWPLVEPLPGGARGLVLLSGDDDQAALACYREQLELVGDFPITYFLLPFTKHTPQSLAALPSTVEFGLHVDALDHPDRYEEICARQADAVRDLTGKEVRTVRNHGFLNRGYLGHVRAWQDNGLALDVNYSGLDGTALCGSFLPFRVRLSDGSWSSHLSLLSAFGDGMLFIKKWTQEQACRRIEAVAKQVETTDPGVLVFNMHPENIGLTRKIHKAIMSLGRRPGWLAQGVESYLRWHEAWQNLTLRRDGAHFVLSSKTALENVAICCLSGSNHSPQIVAVREGECSVRFGEAA